MTNDAWLEETEVGLSKYKDYLNKMFPNLRKRVDYAVAFDKRNYFVSDNYNVSQVGLFPGAHAEVQVVDELAKLRFPASQYPNGVSDEVFSNWLQNEVLLYNRTLRVPEASNNVIMHTCADCFHILYDANFINNF